MNKLDKVKSLEITTELDDINCVHLESGGINIYDNLHSSIFINQKDIPLLIEWLTKVDRNNFDKRKQD